MIGKRSFEAVPKNSRRWSRGDVGSQTVLVLWHWFSSPIYDAAENA